MNRETKWRVANAALTGVWALMVPIAWVLRLLDSVAFVSLASIYANFASHLAAWRADEDPERMVRIEKKLDKLLEIAGYDSLDS